jgi:hypothetical protein
MDNLWLGDRIDHRVRSAGLSPWGFMTDNIQKPNRPLAVHRPDGPNQRNEDRRLASCRQALMLLA